MPRQWSPILKLVVAVVGVIIGIAAARGAAVTLRGMIWGVTIDDPATVFIAAAIMILVSVSASLVPAVRIVRLNPIAAIRPRG